MPGRGLCGSGKGASGEAGSRELRGEGSGRATEPAPGGSEAPAKTDAGGGGVCPQGRARGALPQTDARRRGRWGEAGHEEQAGGPAAAPRPLALAGVPAVAAPGGVTAKPPSPRTLLIRRGHGDFPSDLPRACLQREPRGRATPGPPPPGRAPHPGPPPTVSATGLSQHHRAGCRGGSLRPQATHAGWVFLPPTNSLKQMHAGNPGVDLTRNSPMTQRRRRAVLFVREKITWSTSNASQGSPDLAGTACDFAHDGRPESPAVRSRAAR